MRRQIALSVFTIACLATIFVTNNHQRLAKAAEEAKPEKELRHVVLFKFKESVSKAEVEEVVKAFAALPSKIDEIIEFENGTDVSIEGKAKGFTHGFVVTFENEKGREIYLPHPAHKQFVSLVGPRLEDVLVFDYWTTR